MAEVKLLVKGMKCQGCVQTVKQTLSSVAGVEEVAVDLATGEVKVVGNVRADTLVKVIHEKTSYKAEVK
ncbi:hypothetical protein BREVNS_2215 [Brevinematales bacterium NS]|jgi:copper chaperone CopZ|nr:heavy-metal-associated domain-containing protein [Brevinematales bacterium]QJR22965.1 hypothetical protein BREVNS_2215 [Brevinematales bacterium NS]